MIGGCCRINLRTNFPGEVVNVGAASPTNSWDTKTCTDDRPRHAVCASLQQGGGPPCPTRAGVRIGATASANFGSTLPTKEEMVADDRQAFARWSSEPLPPGDLPPLLPAVQRERRFCFSVDRPGPRCLSCTAVNRRFA